MTDGYHLTNHGPITFCLQDSRKSLLKRRLRRSFYLFIYFFIFKLYYIILYPRSCLVTLSAQLRVTTSAVVDVTMTHRGIIVL